MHLHDYDIQDNTVDRSRRRAVAAVTLIVVLLVMALCAGCGPTHALPIVQPPSPQPVASQLSAVTDSGKAISVTAKAIKADTQATATAVPAVVAQPAFLRLDSHADSILADAVRIDAAAESAKAQDAKNTEAVAALQAQVMALTKTAEEKDAALVKAKASLVQARDVDFRRWVSLAWIAGLALFPVAGAVLFYFRNLVASGAIAASGGGCMGAAVLGQQLVKMQSFFVWSLGTAFVILLAYGVYSAIVTMRRHLNQVVETANALATIPPADGTAMAAAARMIQDVDTSKIVMEIKRALGLSSLPDPK